MGEDNTFDDLGGYLDSGDSGTTDTGTDDTGFVDQYIGETGVTGATTQVFDDGSTLTTDVDGNVIGATDTEGRQVEGDYHGLVNTSGGAPVAKVPTSTATKTNPTTGKSPLASIFEQLGKPLSGLLSGGIAALLTPKIANMLSGGQFDKAQGFITNAVNNINNVKGADLSSLTPQLQYQVMQGTMTPAQAMAAQGQMTGTMNPAQAAIERAVMQGTMTPAQGQAALQEASGMAGVQTDAGSLAGQRAALERLSQIGTQGGMTEADRAQLAATMNATNANAAQQRAAQVQQLQSQGLGGSGVELAARLSGVQGSANANAMAGANVATSAQARALQAIQSGLQGNAALNSQLFGQDAAKAQAQDVVNQYNSQAKNVMTQANMQNQQAANLQNFNMANQIALANQAAGNQGNQYNATNQQNANLQNFNMANQFGMANLNNQQAANLANAGYQQGANQSNFNMANQIAGTNTGIANEQAKLPLSVAQQSFTNALNQATSGANAGLTAGHLLNNQGNTMMNTAGKLFTNVSNATAPTPTAAPVQPSDENLKYDLKEMSDNDVDNMFAKLTGYKYRYKGSKRQTEGVIAQDVEKTPMRQSVVDTPAGKMLSGNEMIGQSMAALANLSQRIRKLEGKE